MPQNKARVREINGTTEIAVKTLSELTDKGLACDRCPEMR